MIWSELNRILNQMKDISSTLTFEYTTKKPVYKIENQVKQE